MMTTIFKRILTCSLFPLLLISCNSKNKPKNPKDSASKQATASKEATNIDIFGAGLTSKIDKNITSILQDKDGNYWFGTNGEGVFRYDGKTLVQFTDKDGLANNQIQTIQEDKSGNIWFGTSLYGVSRFDGRSFTTFTDKENSQLAGNPDKDWKIEPGDLWFAAAGGVYRYNGKSLTYLSLPKTDHAQPPVPANRLTPYSVYCILKDKKGNVWFGTQSMGVCRYDGKTFTWLTAKGLAGPAVRGLFEDKNGNLWFGNNGYGLFKYDGKSITNVTKEKALGNDAFLTSSKLSGKPGPGTMARVWTINEDMNRDIWVGTFDAGVWRYNGKNLTNYTTKDGLTSNVINTIYKDKNGKLWFGTYGAGVCIFNGVSFASFAFE
jgi:ligand-binding sensor domain-containing protein